MYRKILVPLDGSGLAEQVLPLVTELAERAGSQIILLRIPDVPIYETMVSVPDLNAQLREQAEHETREYLDRLGKELRAKGLLVQTKIAQEGVIYSLILNTAKEMGADLIAMSTHGRSGLARLAMGSVADDVVRNAEIPVLLVRPQPVQTHGTLHLKNTQRAVPMH